MSKKVRAILLGAILCVGTLAGCGSSNQSEQASTTEKGDSASTDASAQASAVADGEKFIDDGGIIWDVENQMYVMEDEVLSGQVPLKLWVDNEDFGNEIAANFQAKYPNVKI